jgi:ankyrin repeat protein
LQLRVLVEAGAEVGLKDRWGATALSEAQRVGAREATSYLLPLTRQAGGV